MDRMRQKCKELILGINRISKYFNGMGRIIKVKNRLLEECRGLIKTKHV